MKTADSAINRANEAVQTNRRCSLNQVTAALSCRKVRDALPPRHARNGSDLYVISSTKLCFHLSVASVLVSGMAPNQLDGFQRNVVGGWDVSCRRTH